MSMLRRAGREFHRALRFHAELLERRDCPTIALAFDYRYDSAGFFNDPARRAALERVGQTYSSLLNDQIAAISPTGGNSWNVTFEDPSSGNTARINNPSVPVDTLLIFAGARPFAGSILAEAAPGRSSANGSSAWRDLVFGRGKAGALGNTVTAFAPWGGSVAFNTSVNWYFDADPAGLGNSQSDFTSVAMHELGHVLGFGASPVWNRLSASGYFQGDNTRQFYDGPGLYPPIDPSGHWDASVTDDGQPALLTPYVPSGVRKLATRLDLAGLQDLGWQVAIDPNGAIDTAIPATPDSSGTLTITGQLLASPTDVNLYRVNLAAAGSITITARPQPGSTVVDTGIRLFDAAGREIGRTIASGGLASTSIGVGSGGDYYVGIASAVNQAYSATENPARLLAGATGSYQLVIATNVPGGGSPYVPPLQPPSWLPTGNGPVVPPPAIPVSPTNGTTTKSVPNGTPTPYLAKVRKVVRRGNLIAIAFNKSLRTANAQYKAAYTVLLGKKSGQAIRFGKPLAIASARYDPSANTVTLRLRGNPAGPLQLTVHGDANLIDKAGNLLDGDQDGKPGGDYKRVLK